MVDNLKQIALFIMNHYDGFLNEEKMSYYMLDAGTCKIELYICMDQYTLWINEEEQITFKDNYVNSDDYNRFMKRYLREVE